MVNRTPSTGSGGEATFVNADDMLPSDTNDDRDTRQPSEMEDGALFIRLKRWFQDARESQADERKHTRTAQGFYSGDEQWNAEDAATLREQLRPVITFNRIAPTIDTVAGMEINNRQEIHCYPRQEGSGHLNQQLTQAVEWVRDECDAEDEESDMFVNAVIGGIAWTETRVDYEIDPDGMIVEEHVDDVFYDPAATKRNLRDRRWQIHRRQMDVDRAREMFPDRSLEELDASWARTDEENRDQPHDQTEAAFYRNDQAGKDDHTARKKVTILHAQWYETEDFYRTIDPMTGKEVKFDVEKFNTLNARVKQITGQDLPAVKQKRRIYRRAFVGGVVLEVGDCPCKYDFTFQCITGKRNRNKKRWYGIVEAMVDPQRWANKFFSTILHNIATSGKGVMVDKDAVDNPQKFEDEWSRPDGVKWMRPGAAAAGKVVPVPAGQLPSGLPDMLTFAVSTIRDVSGINLEILGQADRDQPASLEWQRRKSAFSILAGYFDALRHYRKVQGRLLIYMIQEYISDGRLMRIEGQNGNPEYIKLERDPQVVEYDVIVDDAPSSPDQKEATWMILQAMLPLLSRLNVPIDVWVEIIKQSPLPDSFAMKLAQLLEQQKQAPQAPSPEMIKAQAQVQALQAKAQIDQQNSAQQLELKQQEHAMTLQQDQAKAQQDIAVQAAQAESERQIEQVRLQHDMALEQAKAAHAMEIERIKAGHDAQLAQQKLKIQKEQGAFKPKPRGGSK